VQRHHDRLARLDPTGEVLLTEGDKHADFDESWRVVPPFGPFPRALSQTYPFTAETPERTDRAGYEAAAEGVARLAAANPDVSFTLAHEGWPDSALAVVPTAVETVDLTTPATDERTSEDSKPAGPEEGT
jgi:7-cyano-7-deazaguanine tRNA-ribosyltransferase